VSARPSISSALALRAFLAAIAIGMCLGLLFILGLVDDERPLATSVVIAAACLVTFMTAVAIDNGRFPRWMRAGARIAWLAGAGWIVVVWVGDAVGWSSIEPALRALGALTFLSAWTAISGMTLLARSGGAPAAAVRWIAFSLLTAWLLVGLASMASPLLAEHVLFRVIGERVVARAAAASAVLFLGCSITQPVLIRLARTAHDHTDPRLADRHVAVRVRCPRCGHEADVAANTAAACGGCRLLLRVEFEEPRCACGFLIYRLEAPNCPECGRGIPDALRWRPAVTPSPASPPPPSP
jgi:hypothetical protein